MTKASPLHGLCRVSDDVPSSRETREMVYRVNEDGWQLQRRRLLIAMAMCEGSRLASVALLTLLPGRPHRI